MKCVILSSIYTTNWQLDFWKVAISDIPPNKCRGGKKKLMSHWGRAGDEADK